MSLSTRALLAYAAPALPLAALYFPVYVYVAPFYAGMGVALGAIGGLFIAVRLLDAVTDPLMGWASDRLRLPFGRRKPWMALAAPLVAASVWMLMVPPEGAGFGHLALWLCALTLSWTVALTPWYAWGAEIDGDYAGRARVTAWREATALIGTVLAVVLYNLAADAPAGMRAVALFVAVAMPLAAAAAVLGAPEPRDHSRARLSLREAAAALRGNAPFRRLLLAYFVNGCANALPAGLFLFFIEDYLGAPDAGWLLLVYFLCAVAAMPFWAWAARRWSKHRAWGGAMAFCCAVFACALLLRPGDVAGFAVICVLTGLALSADLALPPAMQADVVDVDTAASGEQRTGLFFALWSVATKAALALAGGAALIALQLSGFVAGGANTPEALRALALLYAGAPVALKLLAVVLMWNFPLSREIHDSLRARIEA